MNSTFNSRTAGLILVAVGWAFFLAAIGSPEVLLFTAPVFMLAAPLALGHYLGEELVVRLARAVSQVRRGRGVALPAGYETAQGSVIGALIASNLAGRAPPAAIA